jgi:hypothetical protein
MLDFLTTIYDQDFYDRKTKGKGNQIIVGPFVNLLACTVPECITTYLKTDVITGGFSRRAIFVNEFESDKRIPFPELTPAQADAWQSLLLLSEGYKSLCGPLQFTPEARAWFINWYTHYKLPDNLSIRYFHRTKHILLLKTAILFSLAESLEMRITEKHLIVALEAIERSEPNLLRVFQGVGRNVLAAVSVKFMELLEASGGVLPEKKLESLLWSIAKGVDFTEVRDHLERTEKIVRTKATDKKTGVERLLILTAERYAKWRAEQDPLPSDNQGSGSSSLTNQPS